MMTVWIYVDTNKDVGDVDHLKVFATSELADEWFKENDPEGAAFGYGAVRNAVGIRCGAFSSNMKVPFQAARSIG